MKQFTEFETHPFMISHLLRDIFFLSPHWIKRLNDLPFWTLGSASYKDYLKQTDAENYLKLMYEQNEILLSYFPELYRFQLYWVEEFFKEPAQYMSGMSLPGFHIFQYDDAFLQPMARPHVDVSFNNYEWGAKVGDEIFTHVVAVEVPESGASIRVWDGISVKDIHERGMDRIKGELPDMSSRLLHHKIDQLILHSGKVLHMIEPWSRPDPGSWRITLQSHAVKIDGCWNLYW